MMGGCKLSYNYTNAPAAATFLWGRPVTRVSVQNEGRTIVPSAGGFSDTFGPYEARVYLIESNP